jgi:hypothetical protein
MLFQILNGNAAYESPIHLLMTKLKISTGEGREQAEGSAGVERQL